MPNNCDTLIIGAGAAGLMAAIQCAQRGQSVTLLEKMDRPGRKLLITGKGRCNVTNCCTIEEFMPNVLSNPRFLYSCLNALNPYEVMGFFEECGVPLKVERGEPGSFLCPTARQTSCRRWWTKPINWAAAWSTAVPTRCSSAKNGWRVYR